MKLLEMIMVGKTFSLELKKLQTLNGRKIMIRKFLLEMKKVAGDAMDIKIYRKSSQNIDFHLSKSSLLPHRQSFFFPKKFCFLLINVY